MTAAVITAALFFCNITPFKNAAKDSLPCSDNTNKFILFWVKYNIYIIHSLLRLSERISKESYVKLQEDYYKCLKKTDEMDAINKISNEELTALRQHIENLTKENKSLKQVCIFLIS